MTMLRPGQGHRIAHALSYRLALGWAFALGAMSMAATMPPAHAETLGVRGRTYAPDADAREQFKDVVRRKQASGELDRFWVEYRDKAVRDIKNPAPLAIRTSYGQRSIFNPARFTISSDYRDQNGALLVARGTVIEPLRRLPLTTGLIFADGRDLAQIDYAVKRSQAEPLKIVLTAGSALALRQRYREHGAVGGLGGVGGKGVPFYFDQRAMVINSLKALYGLEISSVPALLRQEGSGLRVEFGMPGGKS